MSELTIRDENNVMIARINDENDEVVKNLSLDNNIKRIINKRKCVVFQFLYNGKLTINFVTLFLWEGSYIVVEK